MKRRPVPPTYHLKSAIRRIDKIVWKLHDEQLAAYIAYVLAVSQGEKREIRKLFGAKFTAFGDLSAKLESKLTPKERRRAIRLTAYETEMAALHDAAQRLQARMEASYMQQRRFKNGILDESEERHPKAPNARQRPAAADRREAHTSRSRDNQSRCEVAAKAKRRDS